MNVTKKTKAFLRKAGFQEILIDVRIIEKLLIHTLTRLESGCLQGYLKSRKDDVPSKKRRLV